MTRAFEEELFSREETLKSERWYNRIMEGNELTEILREISLLSVDFISIIWYNIYKEKERLP